MVEDGRGREHDEEIDAIKASIATMRAEADELRRAWEARVSRLQAEVAAALARESLPLETFLPLATGNVPRFIRDACRFLETRDGCPFRVPPLPCSETGTCDGTWVRRGRPCSFLGAAARAAASRGVPRESAPP